MLRAIGGFAAFAVIAMIVLKFLGSIFGIVFGLIGTILYFAFWGFILYLVLKVFSPSTAAKVKETISGKPAA
ncbi:MAG TPA: hypothetical protein VFV65_02910 [Gemmatimonadales bacterium]|nr:hypothetical protein [Gemmatimonadales bacterium]